jgi:hypothetical protein
MGDTNLPSIRRKGPTAPVPKKGGAQSEAPPSAVEVGRKVGSEATSQTASVNQSAALLDAIRESSRMVDSRLSILTRELMGMRKDMQETRKASDPMLKYYARKFATYSKMEEEYYRRAVKGLLDKAGVTSKFPAQSSIYTPPSSASEGPSGIVGTAAKSQADLRDVGKKIADYAATPITLVDDILAKVISLPFAGIRILKDKASQKMAERQAAIEKDVADYLQEQQQRMEDREHGFEERYQQEMEDRYQQELAEQETEEEETSFGDMEERLEEEVDKLAEQLARVTEAFEYQAEELENVTPLTSGMDSSFLDAPLIAAYEIMEPMVQQIASSPILALPAYPGQGTAEDTANKALELFSSQAFNQVDSYHEMAAARAVPPPNAYDTPLIGSGGTETGGSGFWGDPADAVDVSFEKLNESNEEMADDSQDWWEHFLAPVIDFYATPEHSAAGKYLYDLLGRKGGEDGEGGEGSSKKITFGLDPKLTALLFSFLMVAAPLVLAIAAFIGVLAVGLALLLPIIIRIFGYVADGIKALVGMFIDFFNDPGAFLDKLARGIASAIKSLGETMIDLIVKAFNEIPILKSLATTIDSMMLSFSGLFNTITLELGNIVRGISGLAQKILEGMGEVLTRALSGIASVVSVISGLITALLAILGTALLATVIKILSALTFIEAYFKAGGLFNHKNAVATAEAAYAGVVDSYINLADSAMGIVQDEGVQKLRTNVVGTLRSTLQHGQAQGSPSSVGSSGGGGPGPSSTVNNNTVVNGTPAFSGIPIFGGGF